VAVLVEAYEQAPAQRVEIGCRGGVGRTGTALAALGVLGSPAADRASAARLLARIPVTRRCLIWQDAYEGHYRDQLLSLLSRPVPPAVSTGAAGAIPTGTDTTAKRPRAQLVCCIDTRSEGLRRQLEELAPDGDYQTLGFAGFFAVAIRYTDLAGGAAQDLCPALITPSTAIAETPAAPGTGAAARQLSGLRLLAGGSEAFHTAKDVPLSPFTLAEAGGLLAGPLAAVRTAAPGPFGRLRHQLHRRVAPPAPTLLSVADAFPLAERVLLAQVALTTMGLTDRFAPLVVLCGHGSSTENNPYQAALDCGACGGHRGAPNARTAAAILNDPVVRAELRALDITIPTDTLFLAAEHDTATDRVRLLDRHLIPASHQSHAAQLSVDLARAGQRLAAERAVDLPGVRTRPRSPAHAWRLVAARSADWAQVYPEWGLARNAAFIIGPRCLTAGLNLDRRVFLHSYSPDTDPDGSALETILTAPLVVAQWINAQYYFSTVAPETFGAGTKTVHNAIGGLGVLSGHTGDLQLGLPRQSVAVGEELIHEPMRLLTVAQAPLNRIEAILDRNRILQHLLGNSWLTLTARSDAAQPWQRYTSTGWQPWTPAIHTSPSPAERTP
jgi:uncharacterized protein YbcC (UPF0753/DUF2309 family)